MSFPSEIYLVVPTTFAIRWARDFDWVLEVEGQWAGVEDPEVEEGRLLVEKLKEFFSQLIFLIQMNLRKSPGKKFGNGRDGRRFRSSWSDSSSSSPSISSSRFRSSVSGDRVFSSSSTKNKSISHLSVFVKILEYQNLFIFSARRQIFEFRAEGRILYLSSYRLSFLIYVL